MAEIELSILGQCEMMLKELVQKNRVAVAGLQEIEVFRQVEARLPKMLQEHEVLSQSIKDKKAELSKLGDAIVHKVKVVEEQVGKEKERLGKELAEYRQIAEAELQGIKAGVGLAQGDYTSVKADLLGELRKVRDDLKIANKELQDIEGAKESMKDAVASMAKSVGVQV